MSQFSLKPECGFCGKHFADKDQHDAHYCHKVFNAAMTFIEGEARRERLYKELEAACEEYGMPERG